VNAIWALQKQLILSKGSEKPASVMLYEQAIEAEYTEMH
jgi:hypothetical protein